MPYTALANIQPLIPSQRWDPSVDGARPSPADVTAWIAEVDGEIDSSLAQRYVTPITGTKALVVIGSIAARLVAIRIWGVIHTGHVGDAAIPQDWAHARRQLERLAAGDDDLEDADRIGPQRAAHPGSPASTFDPDEAAVFSMGDVF